MKTPFLFAIIGAAVVVGCGADPKPPVTPSGSQAAPTATAAPSANADDASKGNIVIDSKLAELCNIRNAYFAFDSSSLSNEARKALDDLATCFTTGNAKGKSMRVVGHADPRGELEYNLALGQRRAGMVAHHVVKRGVNESRVESSSRGELDAVGEDEKSWALDRKVDISLGDDG